MNGIEFKMPLFQFLQVVLHLRDMEEKWPHFKEEPRNLRIYLAADGVNPFA